MFKFSTMLEIGPRSRRELTNQLVNWSNCLRPNCTNVILILSET